MAMFFQDQNLCLLNLTQLDLSLSSGKPQSFAADYVRALLDSRLAPVNELIRMLRTFDSRGPLRAPAQDESVGFAIESAIGIQRNSRRTPDYKGIEIKSGRGGGSKTSLFACVPDWELCRSLNNGKPPHKRFCASHQEILTRYGYHDGSRWALYCTVSSRSPNPQGFSISMDNTNNRLVESYAGIPSNVAVWRLQALHDCLKTKHPQTLWVKARSGHHGNEELFFLEQASYTHGPNIAQFDALLIEGAVTIDHRIHMKNGSPRDLGVAFRIGPDRVDDLFSSKPLIYSLGC